MSDEMPAMSLPEALAVLRDLQTQMTPPVQPPAETPKEPECPKS